MKFSLLTAAFLLASYLLPAICEAQAPTQAQLDVIEKIIAPQRQKATAILEADKTGQYAKYKSDVEAIAKQTDPKKQQEMMAKLDADHLAFMRKAYSDAKINNVQVKAEVAKVLGNIKFKFGEFADVQVEFTTPFVAPPPQRFEETLNCPFDVLDENDNSAVVAKCEARASDCSAFVLAQAEIAGGCRSKADVGGKFEVPEGNYTSITVTAQSDISYSGQVLSIAGYGQVNAKFGIRLRTSTGMDKVVMAKEVVALAPVIWYNRIVGSTDNFLAQATYTGSFPGGTEITAQAHTEVFAISAVFSVLVVVDAGSNEFDFIRIAGSN
jgi:hypothetical protein